MTANRPRSGIRSSRGSANIAAVVGLGITVAGAAVALSAMEIKRIEDSKPPPPKPVVKVVATILDGNCVFLDRDLQPLPRVPNYPDQSYFLFNPTTKLRFESNVPVTVRATIGDTKTDHKVGPTPIAEGSTEVIDHTVEMEDPEWNKITCVRPDGVEGMTAELVIDY